MTGSMRPVDFAKRMRSISKQEDIAERHIRADSLMFLVLEDLGYRKGVEIFREMGKWYA